MPALLDCRDFTILHEGQRRVLPIQDPKTGQTLRVEVPRSRLAFARLLDDPRVSDRSAGKTAEAVLVAEKRDGKVAVRFVELKGAIDPDEPARPFRQLAEVAGRFCNGRGDAHGRTGGQGHHEAWAAGDDLPEEWVRTKVVFSGHDVRGIIVTSRGGTKHPPRTMPVMGRSMPVIVLQLHGDRGCSQIGLDELLEK